MGSIPVLGWKAIAAAAAAVVTLAACAASAPETRTAAASNAALPRIQGAQERMHLLNRVTWGATASAAREVEALGSQRYLERQLKPGPAALPPAVQAQIDALTISQRTLAELVREVEQQRRAAVALADPEAQKLARRAYQQELTRLGREAATRSLLRAIYSPNQLEEKMTWFWMNHFNVFQFKANVRAMIGDYEERAIRPHAMGRFRTLLGATARHPAMLRYLDNSLNAANRINENYARELMELHTLGATGGYTQQDVQELARILTGVGTNILGVQRKVRPVRQREYVHQGVFEFNPNRHDYGDKLFLGHAVKGRGLSEVDEALDRLARHPSTARFVSRKLAVYLVADDPPEALVERMAKTFQASDGDIAAVLRTMFGSPEFAASLGHKFKDPVHYVVSAVRLAYGDKPIVNAAPMIGWLNRMGQGLYGRQTPDGYPLTRTGWVSPGQMTTRFEIARVIGSGRANLLKTDARSDAEAIAVPQLSSALSHESVLKTLSPATAKALAQARSPQEWNTYFLSSPEFMNR